MHKKIMNALGMLNLLAQALYTLGLPIGLGILISFLLTEYASAPSWIWAILITLGALIGLWSMVKFILTASRGLEQLEREQKNSSAERKEKEERQAQIRELTRAAEENKNDQQRNQ